MNTSVKSVETETLGRAQNVNAAEGYSQFYQVSSSNALSSGSCNVQDLDLLKEYGLDFKNLSFKNGGPVLRPSPPVSLSTSTSAMHAQDPFGNLVDFSDPAIKSHSQSQWTKFD